MPLICHLLIGPPGSGKSTFAAKLMQLGNYKIISSDGIRKQLYGDENTQGNWGEIEAEIIAQMVNAVAGKQPIIYDATNAKRGWRMDMLRKVAIAVTTQGKGLRKPEWVGWHLRTPLAKCKEWNRNRSRKVPETVIEMGYQSLRDFPPMMAEGFIAVYPVYLQRADFSEQNVAATIENLSGAKLNDYNRQPMTLHPYSRLVDFDRLMHLIAILIRYYKLESFPKADNTTSQHILFAGQSIEEISAMMTRLHGKIYADKQALTADLDFLHRHGMIGEKDQNLPSLKITAGGTDLSKKHNFIPHFYSHLPHFRRLLKIIKFILEHHNLPLDQPRANNLIIQLQEHHIIQPSQVEAVRKDIKKILQPYQILSGLT
ncbi:MAG TPA: ATP-binding protein [Oscillatoriaceae cyanobacterium M33_DOE_052]|nr:ATP-binding protein [Oscillatoriaceae cyanobacterium M33_DOE_052]